MSLPNHVVRNRADLESTSRRHAVGVPYGDDRVLCRILGEFPAFVDVRDMMLGPRLILDGFWESWVTIAIARYVQAGYWCVDVGANYGYFTLVMAAACGHDGHVAACEPTPILTQKYLPHNLALNGFRARVEICPKVVGNVDDRDVEFVLSASDFATSSLERWAGAHTGQTIKAPAITLDRLCADWPRLDFIKIDAEGAETLVWEGMQETLRRFPHAAIALELHLERDPAQVLSFLQEIQRAGYLLRSINYDGDIVPVKADTILSQPREYWALWLEK